MKNKSGKLAFCGVTTALAVLFLLFTTLPIATVATAALAALVTIPTVVELGKRAGLLQYAAVGLLALLLVPAVEGKGLYIAFFGYYTVLKAWLEEQPWHRAMEWGIKLFVFNAATVAAYWVMLTFVGLPKDCFTIGGVSLPWVFLLAGNGVFLLYDRAVTGLVSRYIRQWQHPLRRLFHL